MTPPTPAPRPAFTVISDEVSQDLEVVARFAREFGLGGFELRSLAGRAFKDLTDADVSAVRSRVQAEGWRVVGCAPPVFKCGLDDTAEIARHRDHFKRALEIARTLDCGLVRVFTFLREATPPTPDRWSRVLDHLRGLIEVARGSGVRLGIENEHSCFVATGGEMQRLAADLTDPTIGFVWDPCNVLYVPEATGVPTAEFAALVPRIFHIHIKDAVRAGRAAAASPVGLGDVGWRHHFGEIARSGYGGWLSLETHWRVHALAEAALHLPAGYEFSRGGEEASRVCLHNARAMWAAAS